MPARRFETYFPHVDNVYSHRSTQRYKRKPFTSHYWDCRMKGRPPGTPKSTDPGKPKRKRVARERGLCDVKIKITEHVPEAAGPGGAPRFWTIERVNGNGGNGKGDGAAGPHKHTLAMSDEIKKNSVQRHVEQLEREERKRRRRLQVSTVTKPPRLAVLLPDPGASASFHPGQGGVPTCCRGTDSDGGGRRTAQGHGSRLGDGQETQQG